MIRVALIALLLASANAANDLISCTKKNNDGDPGCVSGTVRVMAIPPSNNGCFNNDNCFVDVMSKVEEFASSGTYANVRRMLRSATDSQHRELGSCTIFCLTMGTCGASCYSRRLEEEEEADNLDDTRRLFQGTYEDLEANADPAAGAAFSSSTHPTKNTCNWSTNTGWTANFDTLMKNDPIHQLYAMSQFEYYVQECD